MEATNNGQTFQYSVPSEPTKSGGYTWNMFHEVNKHLAIGGVAGDPTLGWLKANVHDRIPCKGVFQFGDQGAHELACLCLPIVEQEGASTHGTNSWAALTWVKAEIQRVWDWFERTLSQHDHAIKSIHEECQAIRHDMVTGFDKERLGKTLQEICDRLDAMEAREAARSGVAPPLPTRRTLRERLGF